MRVLSCNSQASEDIVIPTPQGRPKDGPEDKFRLSVVVPRLSELLGVTVNSVDDCIGDKVAEATDKLENGQARHSLPFRQFIRFGL